MVIKETKWNNNFNLTTNIAVDKQFQHDSAPLAPLQPVLIGWVLLLWIDEERKDSAGSVTEVALKSITLTTHLPHTERICSYWNN